MKPTTAKTRPSSVVLSSLAGPCLANALIILFCLPAACGAADWPQWRGPNLNGSADETNLPASLDLEKDVTWKTTLPGPSGATPVISNGRIFVSSMVARTADFVALCLDEDTGKILWRRNIGSNDTRLPRNNMASPSPVATGEIVVFTYGSGDIVAFDYAGDELWRRNLETQFGNLALQFGYSNTPLLHESGLYVIVLRRDHPYRKPDAAGPLDSFMLKLDPTEGDILWKQRRPTNVFDEGFEAYGTPMPFERNGRVEILNTGADFITANDPQTGAELWRYEYWTEKVRDTRLIPSLVTHDGLIVGTKHKSKGVFAIRPPAKPGEPARQIWQFTDAPPDCPTPLIYKDRLYILDGMKNGKIVTCLEPDTGKHLWNGKIGGRGPWRASLTASDDKLYCINESGELIVLAADRFEILYQGKTAETPIQSSIPIANQKLYIRTAKALYQLAK